MLHSSDVQAVGNIFLVSGVAILLWVHIFKDLKEKRKLKCKQESYKKTAKVPVTYSAEPIEAEQVRMIMPDTVYILDADTAIEFAMNVIHASDEAFRKHKLSSETEIII